MSFTLLSLEGDSDEPTTMRVISWQVFALMECQWRTRTHKYGNGPREEIHIYFRRAAEI